MTSIALREPAGVRLRAYLADNRVPQACAVAAIASALGMSIAVGGWIAGTVVVVTAIPLLVILVEHLRFNAIILWVIAQGIATPFLRFPQKDALLTFNRIWIPLTIVLLLGVTVAASRVTRRLGVLLGVLAIYIGLRAVFTGPDGDAQRYALAIWLDSIMLPIILYFVVRTTATGTVHVRRLSGAFAVSGVLLSLTAILEKIIGFELATRSGGTVMVDVSVGVRFSGPYTQPDILAVALLICLAMTLLWTQLQAPPKSVYGLVAIGVELGGIWLTYFRSAWLAALVVIVVALGLQPRRYARLIGTFSLVTVLAVFAFLQIDASQSKLASRVTNASNVSGRLATYKQSTQIFRSHAIFGAGVARYANVQETADHVTVAGVRNVGTAHNNYVSALVEYGIVGLSALVAVTLAVWQVVRQLRRHARTRTDMLTVASLTAAVLAYFLMGLAQTTFGQAPANLLIAVCLGVGAARLDILRANPNQFAQPQK